MSMAMTKKYYEMIAGILRYRFEHATLCMNNERLPDRIRDGWVCRASEVDCVADDLARAFAADNPRFDRARFLKACGLKEVE